MTTPKLRAEKFIEMLVNKKHADNVLVEKGLSMIKEGLDVTHEFFFSKGTPLIYAAKFGHYKLVKALLKAGSDPCAQNDEQQTALLHSLYIENMKISRILIETKKGLDLGGNGGYTPLIWAVGKEEMDLLKMLIRHGAEVNGQNIRQTTPLMYGAYNNNSIDVIDVLIRCGADIKLKNQDDQTASEIAHGQGHIEIADYISDAPRRLEKIRQAKKEKIIKDIDQGLKEPLPRKRFGGFKNRR